MACSLRGAGDAPERVGELFALLPIGRRPDVLGMGREGPGCGRSGARHSARRTQGCAGNESGCAGCRCGISRAMTKAWPSRRTRLAVKSRFRSRPEDAHEVRRIAGWRMREDHAAQHPQAVPRRGIPADRLPAPGSSGSSDERRVSVGWRSDQISRSSPRSSSARISWAMKVSERRG